MANVPLLSYNPKITYTNLGTALRRLSFDGRPIVHTERKVKSYKCTQSGHILYKRRFIRRATKCLCPHEWNKNIFLFDFTSVRTHVKILQLYPAAN